MSLALFDIDLDIVPDAFDALPCAAQEYLKNVLHLKHAGVNGWGWCDIKWEFQSSMLHCIKLCFTGSPSRDIGVTWVYNTTSNQYEEYLTQYHDPVSIIKMRSSTSSFDGFLSNLKLLDFEYIDCSLGDDDIERLINSNTRLALENKLLEERQFKLEEILRQLMELDVVIK
jgi:hypothetical protein